MNVSLIVDDDQPALHNEQDEQGERVVHAEDGHEVEEEVQPEHVVFPVRNVHQGENRPHPGEHESDDQKRGTKAAFESKNQPNIASPERKQRTFSAEFYKIGRIPTPTRSKGSDITQLQTFKTSVRKWKNTTENRGDEPMHAICHANESGANVVGAM